MLRTDIAIEEAECKAGASGLSNGALRLFCWMLARHARTVPLCRGDGFGDPIPQDERLDEWTVWLASGEAAAALRCTDRAIRKWKAELTAANRICPDGLSHWWLYLPELDEPGERTMIPMNAETLALAPHDWRIWAVLWTRRDRSIKGRWKITKVGQTRLALEAGRSRPATACASIGRLCAAGLVAVAARGAPGGGRRTNETAIRELDAPEYAVVPVALIRDPVPRWRRNETANNPGTKPQITPERNRNQRRNETVSSPLSTSKGIVRRDGRLSKAAKPSDPAQPEMLMAIEGKTAR